MVKRILCLVLFLLAASSANAAVWEAVATANADSQTFYTLSKTHGSVHCAWTGASLAEGEESVSGTFQVQVTNGGGYDWVDKTGALITMSGASGSELISLNGVVTENQYRIHYVKNSTAAGTVKCNVGFR